MKRLLIAASIAVLTLAMSVPAMADRDRHHGASSHHYAQDRHHDRHHGKHHRKAHHKRHHRAHRRVVEHHYYDRGYDRRSRHRDDRRHGSDIPLVTVDGYPVVRIQVNH